jgi:hypothetical protein
MSKKIIFKAMDEEGFNIQDRPYPASKAIPEWWKNHSIYDNGSNKLELINRTPNFSFKKCTPMLDALTSGYIIPLHADVLVSRQEDRVFLSWKTEKDIFQLHGQSSHNVEAPPGYSNLVFKYLNTWIPITPKGYSVLITSPFGYRNLPMMAIPAIIDSDRSLLDMANPMWIKDDFEGIIEKGTPLIQVTPFKRDDWEASFEHFKKDEWKTHTEKNFSANIVGHYIKNIWSKKNYK